MDTNATKRLGRATVWIASVLLLASVAVNVIQSYRISTLRSRLEALESEHELRIGSNVPDIIGLTPEGKTQTLHFQDASLPTVLYVFTPQCGWCKKNLPNPHALIDGSGDRYRLVGISLSRQDLQEYLAKEKLGVPVYTDIKPEVRSAYQMGGTPETIVISPDNKIMRVWHGAYENGVRQEIEKFLQIQLPGCCEGN
jgi:peroxiredoxin